jgi:hypothetical protein
MRCPYIGVVPLSEEDQPLFAGRDKEIGVLISNLYASSLTILYGESGVGKTSLIRAGILPELGRPEHRVAAILFREWQPSEFDVNLRKATLKSLLATINGLIIEGKPSSELLEWDPFLEKFLKGLNLKDSKMNLKTEDDLYALPLDRFMKECCAAFYGRLFFVFDQFEDYIYYHPLREKGDEFDAELARAINDRSVPASFLISLREDGLGKLNRLRGRVPDLLANVIKLEHLDKIGALEVINKPLGVFQKKEETTVELSNELVTTILEQTDADRLELDQIVDDASKEIRRSDAGARYKALALQAVLMRVWKGCVELALSKSSRKKEKILISRGDLSRLVRDKTEGENEVRFIVRTYFDQQLQLLDGKLQQNAAEILPHMIRPGSQKKARSVAALAKESGIPEVRVSATLEKLKEDPVNLVREVPTGDISLYELQHDAMAFALQDWCVRKRQKTRERRLIWYAVAGTVIVLLIVAVSLTSLQKAGEAASAKADNLAMEIAMAVNSSGGSIYNPVYGLLIGVDTVAAFRKNHTPVPEKALLALRLGTLQVGHSPSEAEKNLALVWHQIPAMVSPDQKYLLEIRPGRQIIIYKYNDSWKSQSYDLKGTPPFEIAFSKESDQVGLSSSDGRVQIWDFKSGEPAWSQSSGDLATSLGFRSHVPEEWTKNLPNSVDYESLLKQWILEALGKITRTYNKEDGNPPILDTPGTSERFAEALGLARNGRDTEARSLLREEFANLGFEIKPLEISEALATSFISSANQDPQNSEEFLGVAQRLAPNMENRIKAQREIARGNELRRERKFEEAVAAYKNAIDLLPDLKSSLDPEKEARLEYPLVPGGDK